MTYLYVGNIKGGSHGKKKDAYLNRPVYSNTNAPSSYHNNELKIFDPEEVSNSNRGNDKTG